MFHSAFRIFCLSLFAFFTCGTILTASHAQITAAPKHVLVVTVTKGFRHKDSIPLIEKNVEEMGRTTGAWTTDFVRTDDEMKTKMTANALQKVDVIIFGSTTGELPLPDRDAFLNWIKAGHGFVGIHSATDTFHQWPAYLDMIGAEFKTHGKQVWVIDNVEDTNHAATARMGKTRLVFDEIYEFQKFDIAGDGRPNAFHALISMDKHPQTGAPGYFPVSWCKNYGTGRVFYTALGHRPDVWALPWYKQHVQNGVLWALGLVPGDASSSLSPAY